MDDEKDAETKKDEQPLLSHFYCLFLHNSAELIIKKTNLDNDNSQKLKNLLEQRLEKGQVHSGIGAVLPSENGDKSGCYYNSFESSGQTSSSKYIICLLTEVEQTLDLFRADLDRHCLELKSSLQAINPEGDVPDDIGAALHNWHSTAVDYMVRCNLALGDNLKYLVYAALMDHKLQVSGGTEELQTDIKKFYAACSMSDILIQLRESRATQADHSPLGSIDMLTDLDTTQAESQAALTVSITEDSIKLDSSDCNLFCEEWAGKLAKAEYRENALRLKQIIDLLKLKFIQTMNVLKRLLREAEKDFYTLYRTFLFLRDSGNSEILLHYVSTEGSSETAKVLVVLRDFIQEQTVQ